MSKIDWAALHQQATGGNLRWFAAVGWDEDMTAVPCLYEDVDGFLLPYSTSRHAHPDIAPRVMGGPFTMQDAVTQARWFASPGILPKAELVDGRVRHHSLTCVCRGCKLTTPPPE